MKSIQLLLLGILMPMVCAWGQSSQQGENHAPRVIIAVNTTHGEGYFVDSKGNRLFNKFTPLAISPTLICKDFSQISTSPPKNAICISLKIVLSL